MRTFFQIVFVVVAVAFASAMAFASANQSKFVAEIEPAKTKVFLGEPIVVKGTIRYAGAQTIKINPSSQRYFEWADPCEGAKPYTRGIEYPPQWWNLFEEIRPAWRASDEEDLIWCSARPKTIKVRYVFSFEPPKDHEVAPDVWRGIVTSDWCEIQILEPNVLDYEALHSFLGEKLSTENLAEWIHVNRVKIISQYPRSIYAAWVYVNEFQWWDHRLSPPDFVREVQHPDFISGHFAEDMEGKPIVIREGEYQWESANDWMLRLLNEGNVILEGHSKDEYLGPRVLMNVALAQMYLKQYKNAQSTLTIITKNFPKSGLAEKARSFIGALKVQKLL